MKQLRQAVPNLELQFKPCQDDTISEISHTSSTLEGSKLREEKTTYMGVQDKKGKKTTHGVRVHLMMREGKTLLYTI